MKNNIKWVSIVEAIVSMIIIVLWIIWTYDIYFNALFLSNSSQNRITAIEIAREWIETVTNIRDTNWIKFWADYANCWNVDNYDNNCLNNVSTNLDIQSWSYIVWRDSTNKWFLSWWTLSDDYSNQNYKDFYKVNLDSSWFYTQSGWTTMSWVLYTRELLISYPFDTNSDWLKNSNDEKIKIQSLVIWQDRASKKPHKIKLENILTNWKNKIN